MSILLVAALLGGISTTPPVVAAAAPSPSYTAGAGDTWDLENDSCERHVVLRGDVLESIDEIDFHVENHESDTPISRIEILSGRRGGGGDCHDSATAPVGWMAQLQLDGTVVFLAQSPSDVIERGVRVFGFKVGRRSGGGDCCHRHRGYGPGSTRIVDDDDQREDCSCNLVGVTPTSWTQAKFLYR